MSQVAICIECTQPFNQQSDNCYCPKCAKLVNARREIGLADHDKSADTELREQIERPRWHDER